MGITGLKSVTNSIEDIKRNLEDNVVDAVEDGASGVGNEAKRRVSSNNSIWRGNLYNSIDVRRNETRVTIVADVPYAVYVEFGTGSRGDPRAPPQFNFRSPKESDFSDVFPHILRWVNTKPFWYGERGVGPAIGITEKIIEEGQKPHPFMRPAWFQGKQPLLDRAEFAVQKTLRRA